MVSDLPEIISAEELARLIGVHPNTVRRQCREGIIPSTKIGQKIAIPRDLVFRTIIQKEKQLESK